MDEEHHCAYFKTLCLHLDYASPHIDNAMLSSSILCVMTSTDNIIDAVVMCIYIYDYLSTSQHTPLPPLNKMSRSSPAITILRCLLIGVNIVVIALKKYCGGKLPAPLGAGMQFWITELRRINKQG